MKAQEALHEISTMVFRNTDNFEMRISKDCYKNIVNALEKQIPKKPTYEETNNIYGALKRTCANCGDVCFISKDAKPFEHYCRNCGQALDWELTEKGGAE